VLHRPLEIKLREVVSELHPDADLQTIQVRPCPEPKFGDYQSNSLMALARTKKLNPRQLATAVHARLDVSEWCQSVEIAGAGFLNFKLKPEAISKALSQAFAKNLPLFEKTSVQRTVVVDFSSPNVAKPMHVGHIRSTILGDSLARTFRFLGHRVVTDNHIGDWGTQFGKLLVGWKTDLDQDRLEKNPIAEMERLYKKINAAADADPAVLEKAREELVLLQKGDATNLEIWRQMIALSQHQFDTVYSRLGIRFDHTLGESFYNPQLDGIVAQLKEAGLARESEGALVVFFDETPDLKDHPAIVQKKDGAANYTTTDLATLEYRTNTWNPDEILYVTDGRQQLHFRQFFNIFRRWKPSATARLAHVWFGSILGDDGKPFKTRSGDTIRLVDLLDEAEERAFNLVTEKNPDFSEEKRREIARVVGIGAVKYADLSQNRQSDYVFAWEKIIAFNGNTAPYLQYAYTRVQSIFRKGSSEQGVLDKPEIQFSEPDELMLARHLLNFGLTLEAMIEDYRPNFLCNYLYDLAGLFARFYESCPVLKSEGAQRTTRLVLCQLTALTVRQGLELLGIETTEQM